MGTVSKLTGAPAYLTTSLTYSIISGPMPSPGSMVTVCRPPYFARGMFEALSLYPRIDTEVAWRLGEARTRELSLLHRLGVMVGFTVLKHFIRSHEITALYPRLCYINKTLNI